MARNGKNGEDISDEESDVELDELAKKFGYEDAQGARDDLDKGVSDQPANDFRVGHAGAIIQVNVHWSTGEYQSVAFQANNYDVVHWLLENINVFGELNKAVGYRTGEPNEYRHRELQLGLMKGDE